MLWVEDCNSPCLYHACQYISGAQHPARGPHPARDELSSGPPCPAGKVTILGFALQKMENTRRNPSWILFRLSGLSIQDETEVLPTARRLRTLYSFRYFPVTFVYLHQTRTSIHSVTCIFGCRRL